MNYFLQISKSDSKFNGYLLLKRDFKGAFPGSFLVTSEGSSAQLTTGRPDQTLRKLEKRCVGHQKSQLVPGYRLDSRLPEKGKDWLGQAKLSIFRDLLSFFRKK